MVLEAPPLAITLARHGRMLVTREQARDLIRVEAGSSESAAVKVDARDVHMSPSFIAELLVTLVKKRKCTRVLIVGARPRPAKVAKHLASKFGYGDRVEVA